MMTYLLAFMLGALVMVAVAAFKPEWMTKLTLGLTAGATALAAAWDKLPDWETIKGTF